MATCKIKCRFGLAAMLGALSVACMLFAVIPWIQVRISRSRLIVSVERSVLLSPNEKELYSNLVRHLYPHSSRTLEELGILVSSDQDVVSSDIYSVLWSSSYSGPSGEKLSIYLCGPMISVVEAFPLVCIVTDDRLKPQSLRRVAEDCHQFREASIVDDKNSFFELRIVCLGSHLRKMAYTYQIRGEQITDVAGSPTIKQVDLIERESRLRPRSGN